MAGKQMSKEIIELGWSEQFCWTCASQTFMCIWKLPGSLLKGMWGSLVGSEILHFLWTSKSVAVLLAYTAHLSGNIIDDVGLEQIPVSHIKKWVKVF